MNHPRRFGNAAAGAVLAALCLSCAAPDYQALRSPALSHVVECLNAYPCQEQVSMVPVRFVANVTSCPLIFANGGWGDVRGCWLGDHIDISTIDFDDQPPFRPIWEIEETLRHEYIHAVGECLGVPHKNHPPEVFACQN